MIRYLISEWSGFLGFTGHIQWVMTEVFIGLFIILMAYLSFFLVRWLGVPFIRSVITKSSATWDDLLLETRMIPSLVAIVPMVVLYISAPLILPEFPNVGVFVARFASALIVLFGALSIDGLISFFELLFKKSHLSERFSIRSYIQVLRIILVFFAALILLAVILDKRVGVFLSGLGALTAILLIVFKDSILGLVASIQISTTNILKEGDWIEIPKYDADGTVLEISLNTVRIQNFDNTIVVVPSHAVISEGFRNWRGMTESKTRRIKKSFYVDLNSVTYLDDGHYQTLEDSERFAPFFSVIGEKDVTHTNLTLFRMYLEYYLNNRMDIASDRTLMARHLSPTVYGIPIEIYAFCRVQEWVPYEGIVSEITEHIVVSMRFFGLKPVQLSTAISNL